MARLPDFATLDPNQAYLFPEPKTVCSLLALHCDAADVARQAMAARTAITLPVGSIMGELLVAPVRQRRRNEPSTLPRMDEIAGSLFVLLHKIASKRVAV